jgi:hypothetical protein
MHPRNHLHVHHYHYPDGTYIVRVWLNGQKLPDGDEIKVYDGSPGHHRVIYKDVEYEPCSITEEVYRRKTNRRL